MNLIKHFRKRLNFSIYELARRTNMTPSYISNLENGNRTNPSKDTMVKISAALGKTVPEIFFPNLSEKKLEDISNF